MPLATLADIRHAARIDPDITEHDWVIPGLIESATTMIEQACNVPVGWFESTAVRGYPAARRCCIALAALWVDEPDCDPGPLLRSAMLWPAIYHGDMPTLTASVIPDGALAISSGVLGIDAGMLVLG